MSCSVIISKASTWVPAARARAFEPLARRIVRIGEGRYSIELPLDYPPERALSELAAVGASLVSLNPLRDTLEDFFVKHVAEAGRSLDRPAASGQRTAESDDRAGH